MGRKRKAWLYGGDGRRPGCQGFTACWNDYGPSGERRCRSHTFESARLAASFVRRHNAKIDLHMIGQRPEITLTEAVLEFTDGCSAISDSTAEDYATSLAFFNAAIGGDTLLSAIDGAAIDRFITQRYDGGEDGQRSAATVQKHIRNLSRFMTWAAKRGYLAENPIDEATSRPRGRYKRQRPPITAAHLERLIGVLDEDRRLAVWVAITTGLDRGVLARIRWDQLDLDAGFIHFVRPKTRKHFQLPLHQDLIPLLRHRLESKSPASAYVFSRISRQNHHKDWWHAARTAAQLPADFLFRDLRAIATQRVVEAGGDLRDAADLLGHSSVQTTTDHYHVARPSLVQAVRSKSLPGFQSAPPPTPPSHTSDVPPPSPPP